MKHQRDFTTCCRGEKRYCTSKWNHIVVEENNTAVHNRSRRVQLTVSEGLCALLTFIGEKAETDTLIRAAAASENFMVDQLGYRIATNDITIEVSQVYERKRLPQTSSQTVTRETTEFNNLQNVCVDDGRYQNFDVDISQCVDATDFASTWRLALFTSTYRSLKEDKFGKCVRFVKGSEI